jgi:DNA polymerase III delta prime subunit
MRWVCADSESTASLILPPRSFHAVAAVFACSSVNVTPAGLRAIMKLAGGDMRRSLNVLQACHVAYDEVSEANVYACTGNPLPDDMKRMLNILNNEPMKQAFDGTHVREGESQRGDTTVPHQRATIASE